MEIFNPLAGVISLNERRDLIVPGDLKETIEYASKQFIFLAKEAIQKRGFFFAALSGGSTPNAIFKRISEPPLRDELNWSKVVLFWSDERAVSPDHIESNFHNAMVAGLATLPIPKDNLLRMKAEDDLMLETNAREYEQAIIKTVPHAEFDLIMLGMGEDGHTASLFPRTHALHTDVGRLVVSNYIPEKKTWRMTFTYELINSARHICIYVLGKNKADPVAKVLLGPYEPDALPIQRVGTPMHKALWILDRDAAVGLS